MKEETKWVIGTFFIAVACAILMISAVQCSKLEKNSFNECVKITQKPLECMAALNQ